MLRVLKDSTDTIITYPRLSADGLVTTGLPVSATCKRVAPASSDTSYQSATIDSLSTTVQGAISAGLDSITLAGAVAIVKGRRYLITDATHGRTFVVTATNSGTVSTMYIAEPLEEHISNGSTVKGMAVTIALTAAQTATIGQGFCYFRATVDGVVREWDEPFRVVNRITSIILTPTELTQSYPIIRTINSSTDLSLEEVISATWFHVMVPSLSARGVLDEDVLTDDVLMPMHAAACVMHMAEQWPAAPREFVDRMRENFERVKQTTWDRIDLLTAPQDETAPIPQPGEQGPRFMRITR